MSDVARAHPPLAEEGQEGQEQTPAEHDQAGHSHMPAGHLPEPGQMPEPGYIPEPGYDPALPQPPMATDPLAGAQFGQEETPAAGSEFNLQGAMAPLGSEPGYPEAAPASYAGDFAQPQEMPETAYQSPEPMGMEAPAAAQPEQPGHMEMQAEVPAQPTAPIASPDEDWVPPADEAAVAPHMAPTTAAEVRAKPLPRINIQAFCEEQNTASILQQASQDRRLAKTHVSVQMGGLDAAAQYYQNAPTPNLIIIESMHKGDALLASLDQLASVCDSGTKVIVIGHVNDVLLYRELLTRGVSEYLVMPLTVSQLMESLSNLYMSPDTDPLGSVLAFVGAKGGVGSSTICHNTAFCISQGMQSDVVIADLDLPFGTAGLDFNQDPVQGIADALMSPERLDEVLLDRLLSRCSDYLSLFAAPGTLDRPYDLNAGACDTVVDILRKNVPYIAVDVPHLWTEWAQKVLMQSDRVVITALPDLANLRNTKNLIDKLKAARPNDLPPLLVLNQVNTPKRPEISVKDFASAVETDPLAVIEFDTQLFGTATNNGQMIEEVSPKSKPAEQFRELARNLTDKVEAKPESKSLLGPILGKLNLKRSGKKK